MNQLPTAANTKKVSSLTLFKNISRSFWCTSISSCQLSISIWCTVCFVLCLQKITYSLTTATNVTSGPQACPHTRQIIVTMSWAIVFYISVPSSISFEQLGALGSSLNTSMCDCSLTNMPQLMEAEDDMLTFFLSSIHTESPLANN